MQQFSAIDIWLAQTWEPIAASLGTNTEIVLQLLIIASIRSIYARIKLRIAYDQGRLYSS